MNLSTDLKKPIYKDPEEAEDIISDILIEKLPQVNRWEESTIRASIIMLYRYAIYERKYPIWEIPEDGSDFSKKFKYVRILSNKDLEDIRDFLLSQLGTPNGLT